MWAHAAVQRRAAGTSHPAGAIRSRLWSPSVVYSSVDRRNVMSMARKSKLMAANNKTGLLTKAGAITFSCGAKYLSGI